MTAECQSTTALKQPVDQFLPIPQCRCTACSVSLSPGSPLLQNLGCGSWGRAANRAGTSLTAVCTILAIGLPQAGYLGFARCSAPC
jgi:hypothetical protein